MVTVEGITPEYLKQLENDLHEENMEQLFRQTCLELAKEYHQHRYEARVLEMNCIIRVKRLGAIGMPHKEIAELFGVRVSTVRRWLK